MYLTESLSSSPYRPTLKDRAKLILGAAIYPGHTKRWKGYVEQHPVLRDLAPTLPKIVHKIYRPYLSNHLGCGGRVAVLMNHYTAIGEAGLMQLVRRAALVPVTLAEFEGKAGMPVSLKLSAISEAHREGELALHLCCQGQTIYTLSFTFMLQDGARHLALGGLQGLRAANGVIKQLTRELHGFRPKNFMVAILRRLGACLGCDKVILVSNRNRIVVNWRRVDRISSDYDATWIEMKAARRSDGNFELPCQAAPRDLESVPSHKRSEMRKRHALQSAVEIQVETVLARFRTTFGR
ncbi:VirK/YbjX family protein [Massilia terrae]|uniref:VirK/YbjX family protein n=1 Tax=Massilia terrae TaxID=1811224 RepID=A0ABT2D465_9BURK|nr:VirK/YbjX family protein [Massilia terrae]MCS0660113.1 VirK/YbjX family protein [Massilia terrae]